MPRARTSGTVIREIDRSYKSARKLILQGMEKTTPGTIGHLNHIRALADLDRRHRFEKAERGIDAQDLGTASKKKYIFVATVDGELMDDRRTAGERLMVEKLDREFADLPAPQIADENYQDQPQTQLASDEELEEEENEPEEDLESWH